MVGEEADVPEHVGGEGAGHPEVIGHLGQLERVELPAPATGSAVHPDPGLVLRDRRPVGEDLQHPPEARTHGVPADRVQVALHAPRRHEEPSGEGVGPDLVPAAHLVPGAHEPAPLRFEQKVREPVNHPESPFLGARVPVDDDQRPGLRGVQVHAGNGLRQREPRDPHPERRQGLRDVPNRSGAEIEALAFLLGDRVALVRRLPVGSRTRPPERERLGAVHPDPERGFGLRELAGQLDQPDEVRAHLAEVESLPGERAEKVVERSVQLAGTALDPRQERLRAVPEGGGEPDELLGRDVAISGLDLGHCGARQPHLSAHLGLAHPRSGAKRA